MSEIHLPHNHGEQNSLLCLNKYLSNIENFQIISEVFKQLGDTTRVRIFWLLCHYEECVLNIAAFMNMSSPAVSHHLKSLKSSGLIVSRRDGKEVYYKASNTPQCKLLHEMIEEVMKISCPIESDMDHPQQHSSDAQHLPDYSDAQHLPDYGGAQHISSCEIDAPLLKHGSQDEPHEHHCCCHPHYPDGKEQTYDGKSHCSGLESITPATKKYDQYQDEQLKIIRDIHQLLTEHVETRWTVDKLAKKYLMNPTTLKALFKSVYGTSLAAHIKEHRMEKAADLLTKTDLSLSEIAGIVGYASQSKFTAAFKDYYKTLPKDYRKSAGTD